MNDQNQNPNGAPTPPPSLDPIQPPVTPAIPPAAAEPAAPVVPGTPPVTAPTNQQLADMLAPPVDPVTADDPVVDPGTLQKVGSGFLSVVAGIFSWIVFPLAVVLVLHFFVFQAYHVLGTSMNPTLQQTDYLIISKVGYTEALIGRVFHKNDLYLPKRNQIIVFHYPKDPSEIFIKRVIGEPGDRIVIKDGAVTLYTKDKPQGYDPDTGFEPAGTTTLIDTDETVQPGNVFVMGDNRTPGGSYDSREWVNYHQVTLLAMQYYVYYHLIRFASSNLEPRLALSLLSATVNSDVQTLPPDKPVATDNGTSIVPLLMTLGDTTWRIAVPTLGLAVLGLWGDLHLGTKPWLTLLGTAVGFGLAAILIRRQIKDLS